jgi:hypothetical protein
MKREFSAEQLAAIWSKLQGSTPGLYIPVSRLRQVEKLGPRFALFRSYSEISKEDDPAEKYWEKLNETPRSGALSTLSAINLIVALAAIDNQAHRALNSTFIRDEYFGKLAELAKEEGPQPDIQIVFSRAGILTNFKALIATGAGAADNDPVDLHLIGDLSLLCNDFVGGTYLKGKPKQVDDIHLLIEFVATWELDNPRNVAYALTRVERMIMTYLSSTDLEVTKLRNEIGLDPGALTYDGLAIEDYIAIIFGIYGHGKGLNVEAIFRNPGEAIIDPKTFVSKTNFPQDKLEQFLKARSLSLQAFQKRITGGSEWDKKGFCDAIKSDQFATDTLAVKAYPLLQWAEGKTLILDIQYVSELLIYGLYWRIVDSLPDAKAERFISLWGRLLELYLFDVLGYFYPDSAQILRKDIEYEGGQIDALLDFGPDVIIFEFKASLLKDQTKNKRDLPLFEKEVKLKFIENEKGAPKALKQLANAAAAICNGAVKTTVKPERIYPVFVGYEPVLESLFMNKYLHDKFRPFIPENVNGVIVKPITVMSVDELEGLLPNMQAGTFTWPELLNERFDHDQVKAFSVHQAQYDLTKKKGAEIERNRYLLDGFDAVFAEIVRRYGSP